MSITVCFKQKFQNLCDYTKEILGCLLKMLIKIMEKKIGASKVTILPINTQFIFFAYDKSGEHSECSSCFLVL